MKAPMKLVRRCQTVVYVLVNEQGDYSDEEYITLEAESAYEASEVVIDALTTPDHRVVVITVYDQDGNVIEE